MTPAQQVALDAMRSAWPEETVQRMMRATDGRIELALVAARRTMQNEYYNRPRIGMEEIARSVDAVIATFSVDRSLSHVCEGPRADCWCAGLQVGTPSTSGEA